MRPGGVALGEAPRRRSTSSARSRRRRAARDPLRAPRLERAVRPLRRPVRRWSTTRRRGPGTRSSSSTSASTARASGTCTGPTTRRARPSFYRVGWYDNIFDADRMSLYVEIGFPQDAVIDVAGDARAGPRATSSARGSSTGQRLVAEHSVVLDPAYVHITQRSMAEHKRVSRAAPRARASGPSAATAGGPTAPSRTTSSKRAPSWRAGTSPFFVYVRPKPWLPWNDPASSPPPSGGPAHLDRHPDLQRAGDPPRRRRRPARAAQAARVELRDHPRRERLEGPHHRDRPRARREVRRPARRPGEDHLAWASRTTARP